MPKKVGKYDIGKTLGEGTFGKVKYAVNTETSKAVAIKILDKVAGFRVHRIAPGFNVVPAQPLRVKPPSVALRPRRRRERSHRPTDGLTTEGTKQKPGISGKGKQFIATQGEVLLPLWRRCIRVYTPVTARRSCTTRTAACWMRARVRVQQSIQAQNMGEQIKKEISIMKARPCYSS